MNFAFDIDGTITAIPGPLASIMTALFDAGHEVHVLTGTMDSEITANHVSKRWDQLRDLGVDVDKVTNLKIVTNPPLTAKRDYCFEMNIDLMFEDSVEWSKPIQETCPVLLVMDSSLVGAK